MLQVTGPDGALVGENDDLDSLVQDAGLEALTLPADGTYTVRVSRYAATVGEYELTVTPGLGRLVRRDSFDQGTVSWVTEAGELVALTQGKLQMRVLSPSTMQIAFPPDSDPMLNLYLQANARLFGTPGYAEFGLIFRVLEGRAYQFKINTNGEWSVLFQDETSVFTLRNWQAHPALNGTEWTLAVLARDANFSFYANGELLGTLSDVQQAEPGAAGILIASGPDETGPTTVLFDDVLITTRLGSTYRGLPLALTEWSNADPAVVVRELARSGRLTPAEARDLFVPNADLTVTFRDTWFELIGSELSVYDDFILSAWLEIASGTTAAACGLVYRYQDEQNLDLAYVDLLGGFGVVQSRDAQLTTNAYDLSPMVTQGAKHLLVIAQDDRVTLYVNGALVTQETVQPGSGRAGLALLNYDDTRTDCFWSNIWVWPLEDES